MGVYRVDWTEILYREETIEAESEADAEEAIEYMMGNCHGIDKVVVEELRD